jgi:plastocyanin
VAAVVTEQWPFLKRRFWIYPKVEKALAALEDARTPRGRDDLLLDLRGVFHAHSYLSHDSMGTPNEIITGANRAAIDFIFMTDHFGDPADRKAIEDGLEGDHSGVWMFPGVETSAGMIAWFLEKTPLDGRAKLAEQIAKVKTGGGVAFVCHPDEPRDWDHLPPFTGMEIYNLHADSKKTKLTMSYRLQEFFWSMDRYPMQVYHSLFHDPAPYLAIWDRLTAGRRVVGIAGNDAHQNNGLRLIVSKKGVLILTDTGPKQEPLVEFNGWVGRRIASGKETGTTLWRWDIDLYERSYHFVNTHLLARQRSAESLRQALEAGHAYVAFDSLVTATGFDFSYKDPAAKATMGDQVKFVPKGKLEVYAPADCQMRLKRDGRQVAESRGRSLHFNVDRPGVYRVETSLDVLGESVPWIYSNPIYVRK